MYNALCKLNKNISKIEEIFLILLIGGITIVMTLQVVMRFVFQNPLTWSQEITLFLMVYLCFFAADVAFYRDNHIKVDFFVERMSDKKAKIFNVIIQAIIIIVLLMVFRYSINSVIKQINHTIGGVLKIRKSYWILPLTLTFPLMSLKALEKLLSSFFGTKTDKKEEVK